MRPDWLDRGEYPFAPRWLDLPAGRMHYVDEGAGAPLVFVHGTPDWSFGYRNVIKRLAGEFRCVAPDHLGFGLSDKPRGYAYSPTQQAGNLAALIERLDLRDVTLVLHDFGGPFGIAYALDNPANVRGLVLMNTWMWSLRGDPHFERAARLLAGRLGRFLYLRLNFSARVLMKYSVARRGALAPPIFRHYLRPLATPADRAGTWAYAQALLGASDWWDDLWRRRERLRNLPALILWGMRDPAFRPQDLARLETVFAHPHTVRLTDTGHFVPEEAPTHLATEIHTFASKLPSTEGRAPRNPD